MRGAYAGPRPGLRPGRRVFQAPPHWLAAGTWVVALWWLTPPLLYRELTDSLDDSWYLGVVMGFERHLQWGRDLIFSYGPLGFLSKPIYVDARTWAMSFGAAVSAHLLLLGLFAWLLVHLHARGRYWFLLTGLLLLPAPALPSVEHELVLASFVLLLVAQLPGSSRRSLVTAALAGLLISLLAVIKGTALLSGSVLLAVFAAFAVSPRLRRPAAAALLAAALGFAVGWLASGQQAGSLPVYLRGVVEVIGGYSPAMAVDGRDYYDYRFVGAQAVAGFAFLALLGLVAVSVAWRRDWAVLRPLALAAPLMFVDYKEGFVRFGDNQSVFYSMVMIEAAVLLVVLSGRGLGGLSPKLPQGVALLAIVTGGLVLWGPGYALHLTHFPPLSPDIGRAQRYNSIGLAAAAIASPSARRTMTTAARRQMRANYGLEPAEVDLLRRGSVDAAPFDIGITDAYALHWQPRLAMQSYAAYTPYLDRADAALWKSDRRPFSVLFTFTGVDRRYPPWEEPADFRAMLENYRPVLGTGPRTVLVAEDRPGTLVDRPLGSGRVPMGVAIQVPPRPGLVYADIEVVPSAVGRLVSLLYKPASAWVTLAYDGGRAQSRHRLVVGTARDGVLVSPYLRDADGFRATWTGGPGHLVDSLSVSVDDGLEYAPTVSARFYERVPR